MKKFIIIFLLLSVSCFAQTKSLTESEVLISKSGTLTVDGLVNKVSLELYVPQENLEDTIVEPNNWKYTFDEYGNKMIKITWNSPNKIEKYNITFRVDNKAKYFDGFSSDEKWLTDGLTITNKTETNEEILNIAHKDETDVEKVARLIEWIHNNIEYENSPLKTDTNSAIQTIKTRKGVCGEFSNLLASMLRSQDIPVKYIIGYAYSPEDYGEEVQAHAWLEVYVDGKWIAVDPTWMEMGFLDAAHIKFTETLDSQYSETISWKGVGEVDWNKNDLLYKFIDQERRNKRNIILEANQTSPDDYSAVKGVVNDPICSMVTLTLSSCINQYGESVIDVKQPRRYFFNCGEKELYWIIKPKPEFKSYICPLISYDQIQSNTTEKILITGKNKKNTINLDAPDIVSINEEFTITSMEDGLFVYGDEYKYGKELKTSFSTPENKTFYFINNQSYGEKIIQVSDKKETKIEIKSPKNHTKGNVTINVSIESLIDQEKGCDVKLYFDDYVQDKSINLEPFQTEKISFQVSAQETGNRMIKIVSQTDTVSSYSKNIYIYEEKSLLDSIIDSIMNFINSFSNILFD